MTKVIFCALTAVDGAIIMNSSGRKWKSKEISISKERAIMVVYTDGLKSSF